MFTSSQLYAIVSYSTKHCTFNCTNLFSLNQQFPLFLLSLSPFLLPSPILLFFLSSLYGITTNNHQQIPSQIICLLSLLFSWNLFFVPKLKTTLGILEIYLIANHPKAFFFSPFFWVRPIHSWILYLSISCFTLLLLLITH